ncbi:MAG: flagellar assembly protein FliH [Steroidobacterales bacterium]
MSEVAHVPTSRWELPPIDGPVVSRRRGDLDAIEREAWEKGHAEGREAGIALVRQKEQALLTELERRVQRLDEILKVVARPLADLDSEVPRQLASLAGAIARQLVRRALKAHPDEIVAVIRETVALLPMTARDVRIHLHPEDAALIRERLSEVGAERVWSIAEDPILSRGGCRVTSENSSIDAQLEQRMGAAIATLLGDERSGADRQTQ